MKLMCFFTICRRVRKEAKCILMIYNELILDKMTLDEMTLA